MRIMTLAGYVQSAPSGMLGFDADTPIKSDIAEQFYNSGYRFCLRYLSLGGAESSGDLTVEEVEGILNAGLALMPVQHVRRAGWLPCGNLGAEYGTHAGSHAKSIGFPAGVNLWCDVEGISSSTTAADVIAYCDAWYDAVLAAEYVPGLYVGANSILSGEQFSKLKFQHYWKSESKVPDLPGRGYQMIQTLVEQPVHGIAIDKDETKTDSKGGQANWLARQVPISCSSIQQEVQE
jgi:hypothetical protein